MISAVKEEDRSVLLTLYRQSRLIDRRCVLWSLAFLGGEDVFELFRYSLIDEFKGQRLGAADTVGPDEELRLFETAMALGLVAHGSDAAYEFCKTGTDPWFWKENCGWMSSRGSDSYAILATACINAVSLSGREDARDFLESLKSKDVVNRTVEGGVGGRNFAGTLVDGAFHLRMSDSIGYDRWRLASFGELRREWAEWKATEEGKAWYEWYVEAKTRR